MRRRAFLATALTAATATAGCTALESRTEHSDPAVKTEAGPRDDGKYLEFRGEDSDLATVGVDPEFSPSPTALATWVSHRENTELRSLTQRFAAPDGDGAPPQLSLRGPFTGGHEPHPSVSLFRDGGAAVVEVHRFGDLADETAFMGLSVAEWPESARHLVVENTLELAEPGLRDETHVLDGTLEFEVPTGSEAGDGTSEPTG